jgi:hypothetical protein
MDLDKTRKALTLFIEGCMAEQHAKLQDVTLGKPRCPMVNYLCPDDLCILPAGHLGADENIHILGTDPYDQAERYPDFRQAEWGTSDHDLIQFGWVEQQRRFPEHNPGA